MDSQVDSHFDLHSGSESKANSGFETDSDSVIDSNSGYATEECFLPAILRLIVDNSRQCDQL